MSNAVTQAALFGHNVLANYLKREYSRGYSVDNLKVFTRFFPECPQLISETVSRKSNPPGISTTLQRKKKSK